MSARGCMSCTLVIVLLLLQWDGSLFAFGQSAERSELAAEIENAMVRGGVDATWAMEIELNASARPGLGTSTRIGRLRVVTNGRRMWVMVRWEETGKFQAAAFDSVALDGGQTVLTRTKVGAEHSVSISHDFALTGVSDDLPLLTQSFQGLPGLVYGDLARALIADQSLITNGSDPITITADASSNATAFQLSFVLLAHPLRLAEIRNMREIPQRAVDGDPVPNGGTSRVIGWRTIGDAQVPEVVVRNNYAWFPGAVEQDVYRVTYRMVDAFEVHDASTSFPDIEAWLAHGTGIVDERLGITGVIGSDVISMHGERYMLRRALSALDVQGHASLTTLCIDAVPTNDEPSPLTQRTTMPSRVASGLVAATLCVAGGAAIWLARGRSSRGWRRSRAVALVVVLAGSGFIIWEARSRYFPGGPVFDFGTVLVADGPSTAVGSIELTGATDHMRTLVTIVPSCGCLAVDAIERSIPAGETLSLGARFDVASTGEHSAFLTALFDDGTRQLVHVRATGVDDRSNGIGLRLSSYRVELTPGQEQEITAIWKGTSDHVPVPRWRTPHGVRVEHESLRFLPSRENHGIGTWEYAASFAVETPGVPRGLWPTLLEIDGAQASSLFILAPPTSHQAFDTESPQRRTQR